MEKYSVHDDRKESGNKSFSVLKDSFMRVMTSKECWLSLNLSQCTLIAFIIEMHRKWISISSWTGGNGTHIGKGAAKWFW